MNEATKPIDCMDPKPTAAGSSNGVRAFTVFVLSGSLFLLIYNVGRRRMNTKSAHTVRESPPVITNPSSLGGYFSHHIDKPVTRRKPSLTAALDAFPLTVSSAGDASSSCQADHAASAAAPDDGRGAVKIVSSASHQDSTSCNYDTETGPYMVIRKYSGTSQELQSDHEPSSSATGHEGQMIEHMRRTSRFRDPRRSITSTYSDGGRRRSSSSFLGDMSQLETIPGSVDSPRTVGMTRVPIKSDGQAVDSSGQTSPSSLFASTSSQKQFVKPLIYIIIWCALNFSVHVYSSTGWGAKMARFPAPFLKATIHYLMQAIMSSCMLRWPRNNVFVMPWNTYMLIVVPIATAAALDYDLQGVSVFLVTLGMPMSDRPSGILEHAYMMFSSLKDATIETGWDARLQSKGYVPLSVFLFALAFRLESRSVAIAVSIAVIAVGFILGVSSATKFGLMTMKESTVGPLLSGFRWAAIQILLQKRELGVVTPVVTMRALAPSMAMVSAILSVCAEPLSSLTTDEYFDDPEQAFKSCGHMIIGALLGTAMALAELVVVYHTSALTLIILGMLKDLCVVVPRMLNNRDFSEQNLLGFLIFCVGLVSLIWLKYQKLKTKISLEAAPSQDTQPAAAETRAEPSTSRWRGIVAGDFSSLAWQAQQVRGALARAHDAGSRVSRKIYALWELAA